MDPARKSAASPGPLECLVMPYCKAHNLEYETLCIECSVAGIPNIAVIKIAVERFIAATASYNQSPFDLVAIRKYGEAKKKVQDILGIEA